MDRHIQKTHPEIKTAERASRLEGRHDQANQSTPPAATKRRPRRPVDHGQVAKPVKPPRKPRKKMLPRVTEADLNKATDSTS